MTWLVVGARRGWHRQIEVETDDEAVLALVVEVLEGFGYSVDVVPDDDDLEPEDLVA